MKVVGRVSNRVELLREKLMELIQERESLSDPEILLTSQLLDKALNDYHNMSFSIQKVNAGEIVTANPPAPK